MKGIISTVLFRNAIPWTVFCRFTATKSMSYEYGSFRTNERHKISEVERLTTEFGDEVRKFHNVDHFWSELSDEQVEFAIKTLQDYSLNTRIDRLREVLDRRTDRVRMVFENPGNPNNIWAALRTFDSYGIQFIDVIVNEKVCVSTFRQKTMKQAMGTQKWLTLSQHTSTIEYITKLKQEGFRIIASDLHTTSKRIQDIQWSTTPPMLQTDNKVTRDKVAIVMGNEQDGISQEMRDLADELFYIPMKGFAESFNINAACAIVCSHLEMSGALSTPLDDKIKQRLLLTWLSRSVEAAIPLLKKFGVPINEKFRLYEKIYGIPTKPS